MIGRGLKQSLCSSVRDRWEDPWRKRTRNGFLDIKPFWDLSLATMLALEQVSVINHLKRGEVQTGEKQSRNNRAALGHCPVPQGICITIHLYILQDLRPPTQMDWTEPRGRTEWWCWPFTSINSRVDTVNLFAPILCWILLCSIRMMNMHVSACLLSHSVMSYSLQFHGHKGSSVHGILQARILEWVAISLLQGLFLTHGSNPGLLHWQADSLPSEPPGEALCSSPLMNMHIPLV